MSAVRIAVDGLSSYVKAFRRAFRSKLPRYGQPGRAKWRAWSELALVHVVKHRSQGPLSISRRIVQGCADQIAQLIQASQGQGGSTFRQRLNSLARRARTLVRRPQTLQAGMDVSSCVYNICTYHQSLRVSYFLSDHIRVGCIAPQLLRLDELTIVRALKSCFGSKFYPTFGPRPNVVIGLPARRCA